MAESLALERARTAIEGLSVGDAFGEQFMRAGSVAKTWIATRSLPSSPWRWTDDTAMALDILSVLETEGRIDQDALADAFARRWARDPDRGYGAGACRMLHRIAMGDPWRQVSRQLFDGGSMGNGAAMRAAPVGAYFAAEGWERVVDEAAASAEITHSHREGIAGAVAVAVAAAWSTTSPTGPLFERVLDLTPPGETRSRIERAASLPPETDPAAAGRVLGNGSTALAQDTVAFCLWCAARHLDSFEEALWATVSALGDCDTTCAIVGGIVACSVGLNGIPLDWRERREALA